ncbi:MAG TPA: SCO family protein [Gemmata sp.]|nr:SCO family protein [Gemmata sp.]
MARRVLLLVALLAAGCGVSSPVASQKEVDPQWPVGPFSLTERSGKTITDKDLRGSVWIASFIFTRCTGPCPSVSATVGTLRRELKDEPRIKFVTFTVDPEHDDRAKLNAYANTRQADPERWLFLTGDEKTIHDVVAKQFKQGVERHLGPDIEAGKEFEHSTRLVLVDKDGVIRGVYPGMADPNRHDSDAEFAAAIGRLKARARELAK